MLNRITTMLAHLKTRYLGSFRGRMISLTLGLSLTFLWLLVFASSAVLERLIVEVLFDQQFASAQRLAADLDSKLRDRLTALTSAAAHLPDVRDVAALDAYLAQLSGLQTTFTVGLLVTGLDGRVIADSPLMEGRRGAYYGDRAWFHKVRDTRLPYIDKPVLGRLMKRPLLAISVPVLDRQGRLLAVLSGVTDLNGSNFLGLLGEPNLAGKGEFYVISPGDNMIVASSEPGRTMEPVSPPGVSPMWDHFSTGAEGSLMAANSRGQLKLYSAKKVAASGWLVLAALPADVALRPVTVMRQWLILMAGVLTVLAVVLTHLITRRLFAPLDEAHRAMRDMASGTAPMAPLPVKSRDEIGGLIDNFNVVVQEHHRAETALAGSEKRFRMVMDNAPDAIMVETRGCFAYVNAAALSLFGANDAGQLLGTPVADCIAPASQARLIAGLEAVSDKKESIAPCEETVVRLDGSVAPIEVSAFPLRFENVDGALIFARDITKRKLAEEALLQSGTRMRELAYHLERIKEDERKRIARDIHDELGQTLLTLRLDASAFAERTAKRHPRLHGKVRMALGHIDNAIRSVKAIINDLRPSVLDLGLLAALEWQVRQFEKRSAIDCILDVDDHGFDRKLDENQSAALFRVVQESLMNIERHSSATEACITVRRHAGRLDITIADNGVGITDGNLRKKNSFGLIGIEERIAALGGAISIQGMPGKGTSIRIGIPLAEARETLGR